MKKLFLLFALGLSLASCVTQKYTIDTSFVDFRKYKEKGFFLSMYKEAPYDYEYIGYIEATVSSGETAPKTSLVGSNYEYRIASTTDAIEALYKKAIEVGADGIIDLKFTYSAPYDIQTTTFAKGVAIKMK